jgi:hypothetical protein
MNRSGLFGCFEVVLLMMRTLIERFHGLSFEEHRRGMCICKYGERETPREKEKREIKENNK